MYIDYEYNWLECGETLCPSSSHSAKEHCRKCLELGRGRECRKLVEEDGVSYHDPLLLDEMEE